MSRSIQKALHFNNAGAALAAPFVMPREGAEDA
jgi:hypothetical protein